MKEQVPAGGRGHELAWLGMGFVLPCASQTFYRQAARRRLTSAVLFFLLFSLCLTGVSSLSLGRSMATAQADIRRSFEAGGVPEIIIKDGLARVSGQQPLVLVDEGGTIVVIDTTGAYRRLDRTRYTQGLLLTRTELHIMNTRGQYEVMPLGQLQQALGMNPIVINADTVTRAWQAFAGIFAIVAAVLLAVWNVLVRFAYLAVLALVAWGLLSLGGSGMGYGPVLITGLYALVPAMYVSYLLGRLGITFIFLQTIIVLFIWAIALWGIIPESGQAPAPAERPLRGWRALAGIPFLFILALDGIFRLPYGAVVVWAVALLTLSVLVAAGLLTRRQADPGAAGGAAPATP